MGADGRMYIVTGLDGDGPIPTEAYGPVIALSAEQGTPGQTFQDTGIGNLTFGGNGTAVANLSSNINGMHFGISGTQNVTIGTGANLNVGSTGTAGFNTIGYNPGDTITLNLSGNGVFNSGNVVIGLGNLGATIGAANITLNISGTSILTAQGLWVSQGSSIDDVSDASTATVNQTLALTSGVLAHGSAGIYIPAEIFDGCV